MKLMPKTSARNIVAVVEGGKPYVFIESDNSLEVFFELMEVVQLLCPRWPPRAPDMRGEFKL